MSALRYPILFVLASMRQCMGMNHFIIENHKSKCVNVEAAEDTEIFIKYEAPDLILDKHDKRFGPAYLSVNVKSHTRVMDAVNHEAPIRERLKPQTVQMAEKTGNLTHVFEVDGSAQICIRAASAKSDYPMRFALNVLEMDIETEPDLEEEAANGKGEKADVHSHLSHMELELQRIQTGLKNVMNEANYHKERDAQFHKQTEAMHSATVFWPIVQVCVLLMTGFTQASHIVRFFQSRRLI